MMDILIMRWVKGDEMASRSCHNCFICSLRLNCKTIPGKPAFSITPWKNSHIFELCWQSSVSWNIPWSILTSRPIPLHPEMPKNGRKIAIYAVFPHNHSRGIIPLIKTAFTAYFQESENLRKCSKIRPCSFSGFFMQFNRNHHAVGPETALA